MITITMPTSFAVMIAVLLALDIIKGALVLIDNRLTRTRMSLTKRQTDCPKSCPTIDICTKDDTDCPWK